MQGSTPANFSYEERNLVLIQKLRSVVIERFSVLVALEGAS